jgi:quinoprotein glucose dehydrogenase
MLAVKNSVLVCALLSLVGLASVHAKPAKQDLNFQQSPARPTPDWVKLVDHGQFDPRLKGYFAPEGIKIDIVADAPDIINPVGMTFDLDGNLYVLEWVEAVGANFPKSEIEFTYKDGSKRKVLIMRKPVKDRVKLLGYNAKKAVFDSAKVVLEEDLPSSILIHDGWMYLSGQGTVRRYKQEKDGSWGKKEIIAQGFCGYHHHQVSGLTIGNDGWLYITSGDNDNFVEGSDGSRATVLRTGAIFRCKPDGSKMHTHSIGYRNPYRDVVFDNHFNMFHADNDNEDGSKWTGCRLMHIPEGVDFGWRLRPGAECCVPDFVRSAVYGELPGKMSPMLKTGRGSPAGLLLYNDTYFPDPYKGLLYYPDVFRKVVRAYQVAPLGATFEVTHEFELLRSNDPLFRPCQMVLGPDGAMYVCDWRTDSGGAGKLWGDGKHGRIYRLSWKGTKDQPEIKLRGLDSWAKITKQADEDLYKTLESDNFSDRQRAQHEIIRQGAKHHKAMAELLKNTDNKPIVARIAALGVLQSAKDFDAAPFIDRLGDFSPDIRRLAADALALGCKKGDGDAHDALVRRVNDEDLAVRRAVYLAIGRIGNGGASDVIVNGLQFDKREDAYFTDGLVRALELTGKDGITNLLDLANSGSETDLARVVDIYPTLRTREAAEKLPVILNNYHVKPEQKIALIRAFAYYQLDPPISVEPLVTFLDKLPAEPTKKMTLGQLNSMKLAALDVLAYSGKVDSARLKTALLAMLKTDDAKSRDAVLQTIGEAKLTSAVPILIEQLAAANDDAIKLGLIRTLGQLSERSTFKAVQPHVKSKDPAMRIEVLRALASIDNLPARDVAEQLLSDDELTVQREAVVTLGQSIEGARIVGKRFADKKLPRSLLPEVTESLRRFASKEHPDVNELLSRVVKGGLLVSLEPAELKRVSEMVRTQGDPVRGRNLYLNNKAVGCISCHRLEGVGGNVGPDLTRVWDTLSLEKVMESMLDPSKEIKEGYQSYVATTKKGLTYSGLKVAHTAKELILKDATGKEIRIAADDLDGVVVSKTSLMPDDVVKHLSINEFIDLVSFLRDRKSQEELRGLVLTAWAIGPFDADLTKGPDLAKTADPTMAVLIDNQRLTWRQVQANMAGKGFDLRPVIGDAPASGYLLTYVFSPKEQKVDLHHQSEEKLKLWHNGTSIEAKAAMTPLTLAKGWNVLLLRVANAEGSPFVSARIVGGEGEGVRVSLQKD